MRHNQWVCFLSCLMAFAVTRGPKLAHAATWDSQGEKSIEQAIEYFKKADHASNYLAYRDIPNLIEKYVQGDHTLDYGAGTGISTQFLLAQNLKVVGVDISPEMLSQAIIHCPETDFHVINDGIVPADSQTYDLVFSGYVLFEIGSEEEMVSHLQEANRVMKDDGVFIALTGSEHMYSKTWYGYNTDYPENKNLKSGDLAKIRLCDADMDYIDFYWTEDDYRHFFETAGFEILEMHYPLGQDSEPFPWIDERTVSPFLIVVARKIAT